MKRKFIDSNVFLYAYLKPRRKITEKEKKIKSLAREIIERIEDGQELVVTTVVHISEILNIIEDRLGLKTSQDFLETIIALDNFEVCSVDIGDYHVALEVSLRHKIGINDALAYIKMRETNTREIYTFDKHFRNLKDIKVLPEPEEYE